MQHGVELRADATAAIARLLHCRRQRVKEKIRKKAELHPAFDLGARVRLL